MSKPTILTHRLDSRSLDIIHVEQEGEKPFTFLPFDDSTVERAELIDDEYLMVLAWRQLAIWHLPSRQQTLLAVPFTKWHGAVRTFSASRKSLFVVEFPTKDDMAHIYIRELRLDGSLDQRLDLPHAAVTSLGSLIDGRVVAFCSSKDRNYFCVIDPETGFFEEHDLPSELQTGAAGSYDQLRISPDGRLAARCHLGSVPRFSPVAISLFEQTSGRPAVASNQWPDQPDINRNPCYGFAFDIYDTLTGKLTQRLLGGLKSMAEIVAQRRSSGHAEMDCYEGLAVIGDTASKYPYSDWDGKRQVIFRSLLEDGQRGHGMDELSYPFRFLLEHDFSWVADSSGLVVPAGERKPDRWGGPLKAFSQRWIGLNGKVGPLEPKPEKALRPVPKPAVTKISRELSERSTVTIVVPDEAADGAAIALATMANKIESGIEPLVYRDALTFVFKSGRRRVGETSFFKELRSVDPVSIIPPLRRIVGGLGAQARSLKPVAHEQFLLGERSKPHEWRTALAPAALLLAEIDSGAGGYLRDWFLCVDQEHDNYASDKVMPAFARSSGFDTEEAVKFGFFFFLQQWQTLSYKAVRLGLTKAASRYPSSSVIHWIADEQRYIAEARKNNAEANVRLILDLLTPGKAWDDEVATALKAQVQT